MPIYEAADKYGWDEGKLYRLDCSNRSSAKINLNKLIGDEHGPWFVREMTLERSHWYDEQGFPLIVTYGKDTWLMHQEERAQMQAKRRAQRARIDRNPTGDC